MERPTVRGRLGVGTALGLLLLMLAACQDDLGPGGPVVPWIGLEFQDTLLVVDEGFGVEVTVVRLDPEESLSVFALAATGTTADSTDFQLPVTPIEFQPRETRTTFLVTTSPDPYGEIDEEIVLGLSPLGGEGALPNATCRIRILDAGARPILSWSPQNPRFVEESDDLHILYVDGEQVSRPEAFEVRWIGGTAEPAVDFRTYHLSAVGPNRRGSLYFTLVADGVAESDETLTLELVPDSSWVHVSNPEITITLVDTREALPPETPIHFPLEVGRSWSYGRWDWRFHEVPDYSERTESVRGTREIEGQPVAVLSDDGRRWSGYRQEGQVVYRYEGSHAEEDSVEVRRYFDFLTPDERWEFVQIDTLRYGEIYIRHEWMENLGRVTVATPAGVFRDVHAFTYHEFWRDDAILWWSSTNRTYYVADGVGIVEMRGATSGRDAPGSRSRTELLGDPGFDGGPP